MNIVILDEYLVCRGNLDFEALRQFGEVVSYPATARGEAAERIGDAEAVFLNRVVIDREVLSRCPNLRFIGITATGYNMIDLEAAGEFGVTVCNVPAYSTEAVAQLTFALLLEIACGVSTLSAHVHAGNWRSPLDPFVAEHRSFELCGKTMGIVGMGDIGYRVAQLANAFGMDVLGYRRHPDRSLERENLHFCDLDDLLERSDVVSVHCPLTSETRGLIGERELARMKDGAVLLNTSRGPVLNEAAVAAALDSGKLYAAGLDVLSSEPPKEDNPLARHPRCVVTPHVAWTPRETRARLIGVCVENLRCFLEGRPQNVVNQKA